MRTYFGRKIELLAPVGELESLEQILQSPCDAVYLGGKSFNMRMHSELKNLDEDELIAAIELTHKYNKQIYVTLNTWIDESELTKVVEYLKMLSKHQVDAVIVQDYAIISLIKKHQIEIEVHSSVMMNIHNQDQIKFIEELGITRYVASRELSLKEIKELSYASNLEIEYFVSGDMCTVHGSQCHYSGMIFNKSANRGQCFKMCRWKYELTLDNQTLDYQYFLAAKDMNLIDNIKDLVVAGVNSLKIEGRRKPVNEIVMLVNAFDQALRDFAANPFNLKSYQIDEFYPRSTSTAYAFGKPGISYINEKNEGNTEVLKVFSKYGKLTDVNESNQVHIREKLAEVKSKDVSFKLSVKVQSFAQALLAFKYKVDFVYVSLEALNGEMITPLELNELNKQKGESKLYLSLPVMTTNEQSDIIEMFLQLVDETIDGLVITHVGQLKYRTRFNLIGDYSFNIHNTEGLAYFKGLGLERNLISIETNARQMIQIINQADFEMIIHGYITVMLLELDLYENFQQNSTTTDKPLVMNNLINEQQMVYNDSFNRNHILSGLELNLSSVLLPLVNAGLKVGQIEARIYDLAKLETVLSNYVNFRDSLNEEQLIESFQSEYEHASLGALNNIIEGEKYVIKKPRIKWMEEWVKTHNNEQI
ncbi:MAG: U32 family peptidase [Mycoplasmatales bacterium]